MNALIQPSPSPSGTFSIAQSRSARSGDPHEPSKLDACGANPPSLPRPSRWPCTTRIATCVISLRSICAPFVSALSPPESRFGT